MSNNSTYLGKGHFRGRRDEGDQDDEDKAITPYDFKGVCMTIFFLEEKG